MFVVYHSLHLAPCQVRECHNQQVVTSHHCLVQQTDSLQSQVKVKLVIVYLVSPGEQPCHKLNCKYFQLFQDNVIRH